MKKGFTLAELLITIMILLIIMFMTLSAIMKETKNNELHKSVPSSGTIFMN